MRALSIIAILCSAGAMSQWDVPARLELNGVNDGARQVTGLSPPAAGTDGVAADVARLQQITHADATGTDQLVVTLSPAPAAYSAGMALSFEPAAANTGPATLNVNGLGAMPVLKFTDQPLDSADLRPGIPVHVVFDGAAFQLTAQSHPACPAGYMAVSRDACIETQASPALSWYDAAVYCADRGARLCSFGEWYQACEMPGGILPGISAFEWVDHAANNTNYAKLVGQDGTLQIGCKYGGLALPSALHLFRCCWDR